MPVTIHPNSTDKQRLEIADFVAELPTLSDEDLSDKTEQFIWLSAYANNNPRSAYHPMCDATSDEWHRRGNPEGYSKAHAKVMRQEGYG